MKVRYIVILFSFFHLFYGSNCEVIIEKDFVKNYDNIQNIIFSKEHWLIFFEDGANTSLPYGSDEKIETEKFVFDEPRDGFLFEEYFVIVDEKNHIFFGDLSVSPYVAKVLNPPEKHDFFFYLKVIMFNQDIILFTAEDQTGVYVNVSVAYRIEDDKLQDFWIHRPIVKGFETHLTTFENTVFISTYSESNEDFNSMLLEYNNEMNFSIKANITKDNGPLCGLCSNTNEYLACGDPKNEERNSYHKIYENGNLVFNKDFHYIKNVENLVNEFVSKSNNNILKNFTVDSNFNVDKIFPPKILKDLIFFFIPRLWNSDKNLRGVILIFNGFDIPLVGIIYQEYDPKYKSVYLESFAVFEYNDNITINSVFDNSTTKVIYSKSLKNFGCLYNSKDYPFCSISEVIIDKNKLPEDENGKSNEEIVQDIIDDLKNKDHNGEYRIISDDDNEIRVIIVFENDEQKKKFEEFINYQNGEWKYGEAIKIGQTSSAYVKLAYNLLIILVVCFFQLII